MTVGTSRRGLFGTSALAGALALSIASGAVAQERVYSIPAQPLAASLRDYGMASGEQIIFAETIVSGRQAPALQGAYGSDEALSFLLADSGLIAERVATGGIMIRRADAPQSGSAAGDGAEGTVDTLVVTAQKREEDIQDVPIAISAFTQEDLTRSQVAGGPDLMTQVPNFTFTKTNFSSYSIQIRGIGTQAISATTDPAVAVAFNNTPFVRNRFFEQEFYDLQRIEVLRGPQGTLYGRNATAGVVNIISAKPSFDFEAKLSGDVSNYNSTRLEGMLNLPLAEDAIALRLAAAWTKRDGFVTNEITGNPIDGRDLWSTRVSLRFTPNERFDANLIWEHFEENDDRLRSGKQLCHQDDRTEMFGYPIAPVSPGVAGQAAWFSQGCIPASLYSPDSFEAPNGYSLPYFLPVRVLGLPIMPGFDPYVSKTQSRDLRVIESTVDPEYRAKSDLFELQFSYDLTDNLTLSSETAYNYDNIFSMQDFNRFNTRRGAFKQPEDWEPFPLEGPRLGVLQHGEFGGIYCDPQIGCADRLVGVDLSTARSRQFSQEFRVASDFEGPFNFSLGANFLRYDTEDKYYVFINTLSMYAAGGGGLLAHPYVPGYYTGDECMKHYAPADPTVVHQLWWEICIAMDPNPIGSLNDEGHNYFLSKNPYKLISYAAFGEAYYNLTDNLKVTAGLRWTVDKKEAPRIPSALLIRDTIGLGVLDVEEQEWREPTGRLTVDWKPDLAFTDETLLYGSYARGYKAGGSNPPLSIKLMWSEQNVGDAIAAESLTKPKTFDAEFVDAFELGAKNTLLDGQVTLNLAAFYYDYKDYQISQIIDRSAVNYNFDAEVWGLELEADWRPLENLRFGLKLGYENTRVGDGERAIDIMERNAGHGEGSDDPWVVIRPFPTFTENCVVPLDLVNDSGISDGEGGTIYFIAPPSGQLVNGYLGPCEYGYALGHDPITNLPYVPNPTQSALFGIPAGYPGFNPWDDSLGHNRGEGFFKELGGNELPNAPHYTATLTADYTLPLPNDWLATLHTDLYYQSEAWTRIFNMEGYDKLKAYTNVNLAAIFTNEDAGWHVMAYVKNVFDRDSITGAFLFPDDVGLTTNVFLTEPRLYGLRVTKEWNGSAWWSGLMSDHAGPYPLTVELGGSLARIDGPYSPVRSAGDFTDNLDPARMQNQDRALGEGGEVKLTYRPLNSPWHVSGGLRFGKTKGFASMNEERKSEGSCGAPAPLDEIYCDPNNPLFYIAFKYYYDKIRGDVTDYEKHTLVDFEVGRDVGLGGGFESTLSAGLRYAEFESRTRLRTRGIPDGFIPEPWFPAGPDPAKYTTHTFYRTDLVGQRDFEGVGPTLSWDLSKTLAGTENGGSFDLDAGLTAGVLFGKHRTSVGGSETATFYSAGMYPANASMVPDGPAVPTEQPGPRSQSATVPLLGLELGLSYNIQRVKLSTGYRWERYFDVLDAGFDETREADRTIDGPYLKLSVGFGG